MKAGESHSVPTVHFADPPASCVSEKSEKSEVLAKVSQVHEKPLKGPPIASICKLFSLVDFKESLILLLGLLGAIGNGVTQPVVLVVFGDLIDGMGSSSVPVELPANVTPEQMALLMDDAMDGMMSEMERLCIIMCLIGVANTVAATLQGACFKIFSDMQTKKYRVLYFKSVLFQDVSWLDLKEVAALPSEVNDDLEKIGDALGDKLGNGIMSFSAFVGGFGCAFGLGWLVALVMCAMLPFMGVGAAVMGKAVQEIQLESQSWYSKAACVVEECLYAMRTVVAFGGERRELQKFCAGPDSAWWNPKRLQDRPRLGLHHHDHLRRQRSGLLVWDDFALQRPGEPGHRATLGTWKYPGHLLLRLHWEFHDRQPGPFAEGPCGRALCGRPLLSGEGEPPAGAVWRRRRTERPRVHREL